MTMDEKFSMLIKAVEALEDAVGEIVQNSDDPWGAWAQMQCATAESLLSQLKEELM